MEPANREETRNPDGTFKPGISGNPNGRPKNTLKDYLSRKFSAMTDEEKEAWLADNKVSGEVQFKMAEGNPHQSSDVDLKGDVKIEFHESLKPDVNPPQQTRTNL